ncbi:MAG: hypothetical protein ACTS7I_00560 [Candidatus Hodgkinia cicadicola]
MNLRMVINFLRRDHWSWNWSKQHSGSLLLLPLLDARERRVLILRYCGRNERSYYRKRIQTSDGTCQTTSQPKRQTVEVCPRTFTTVKPLNLNFVRFRIKTSKLPSVCSSNCETILQPHFVHLLRSDCNVVGSEINAPS